MPNKKWHWFRRPNICKGFKIAGFIFLKKTYPQTLRGIDKNPFLCSRLKT
jgi:hypothetical protein